MKKFCLLLLIACLGIFLFGSSSYAYNLGSDITIWDKISGGAAGTWWAKSGDGSIKEDNEVEWTSPGYYAMTGQKWDLEGFFLSPDTSFLNSTGNLVMVGGYNFGNGQNHNSDDTGYLYTGGDLFIDTDPYDHGTGSTPIQFGSDATGIGGFGPGASAPNQWGYNLAVKFNWTAALKANGGIGTAEVYEITSATLLEVYDNFTGSNPWKFDPDNSDNVGKYLDLGPISFYYDPLNINADVGGLLGSTGTGGFDSLNHYLIALSLWDLSGFDVLVSPYQTVDWYVHYTYECGNDDLMGEVTPLTDGYGDHPPVPIPPSVLLLASGLLGFLGIGIRKRVQ